MTDHPSGKKEQPDCGQGELPEFARFLSGILGSFPVVLRPSYRLYYFSYRTAQDPEFGV